MSHLPRFAPYPKQPWRNNISSSDWASLVEAWTALVQAYLALPDEQLIKATAVYGEEDLLSGGDGSSVTGFVAAFTEETAWSPSGSSSDSSSSSHAPTAPLLRTVFQLTSRILGLPKPPAPFLQHGFLSSFAKAFPKKHVAPLISNLFSSQASPIEASLTGFKKLLIPQLDAGIKGDLKLVESRLTRINPLLHASPHACTLLLAGSDFFDGLVTCFRVMNPPLRKVIATTMYLCLVGLTETEPPKWVMLSDQLYALKSAADAHRQGPINANDSLVPELVTSTPLLSILQRRAEASGAASGNLKSRITALEGLKKGPMVRPRRLVRRKIDKGKNKETAERAQQDMRIHRMSQITQIQDLFPDLGDGFVSKCLDEYGGDVEQVVANLLSESLPPHLAAADRAESLYALILTISSLPTNIAIQIPLPWKKTLIRHGASSHTSLSTHAPQRVRRRRFRPSGHRRRLQNLLWQATRPDSRRHHPRPVHSAQQGRHPVRPCGSRPG
jgi:activating signal cointegrator complex subunit 2